MEASPSLTDRFFGLRNAARRGGPFWWLMLPWVIVAAPFRLVYHGVASLLLRGRAAGAGMRSRRWRHLFEGLPSVFATLAVLVVGGFVLGRESNLHNVYHAEASKAFADEDFEKARLYFERLYQLDRGSAETQFYLGVALNKLGHKRDAMSLISSIAEGEGGGDPRANAWIAATLLADETLRRKPEILATIYRNLLKARMGLPKDVRVKLNLANYHLLTGEFRKAIPYLERAAEENPVVNIDLAQFYSLDGRLNSARTALERAEAHLNTQLEENPLDHRTRMLLAKAISMQGKFRQVLEILKVGRAIQPHGPYQQLIAQTHVAVYDSMLKDPRPEYEQMLYHLGQALRIDPGMEKAIVRLVSFGEVTGEAPKRSSRAPADPQTIENAEAMLRKMLADGKMTVTVHMALGLKGWRDNNFEKARMHFEAAYDLDPTRAEVSNNLAWVLTHQKLPKLERALAVINTVLDRHPDVARYRDTRGEVYLAMEQWDSAIRDLEFALRSMADQPRIHRSLAKAYEATGAAELAQEHRRAAARLENSNSAPKNQILGANP